MASNPQEKTRYKRRVAMLVGYKGTNYRGLMSSSYQTINKNISTSLSIPTIEEVILEACYKAGLLAHSNYLYPEKVGPLNRSSRTDKGVHAGGVVLTLKLELGDPLTNLTSTEDNNTNSYLEKLPETINKFLPHDIRVFGVVKVTKNFSARRACNQRYYEYYLPTEILNNINSDDLNEILSYFLGTHNIHNFTKAGIYKRSKRKKKSRYEKSRKKWDNSNSNRNDKDENSEECFSEPEDEMLDEEESKEATEKEPRIYNTLTPLEKRQIQAKECYNASEMFRTINTFQCSPISTNLDQKFVSLKKFTLAADSYALHQIRKMIASIVCVAQGIWNKDIIRIALDSPYMFNIPLAPSCGLLLTYRNGCFPDWRSKNIGDQQISFSDSSMKALEQFTIQVILPEIISSTQQSDYKYFLNELQTLSIVPDIESVRELFAVYIAEKEANKKLKEEKNKKLETNQADS